MDNQNEPKYYIQTNNSWLCGYVNDFNDMDQIIDEIDGQLEENLPIMIFGKEKMQRRSVGFFSDSSIGYKYSKRLVASKPLTPTLMILLNEINEKFEILEIEHNCLKENYDKNFMNFDCGQNTKINDRNNDDGNNNLHINIGENRNFNKNEYYDDNYNYNEGNNLIDFLLIVVSISRDFMNCFSFFKGFESC
jgi:hypothetical protein